MAHLVHYPEAHPFIFRFYPRTTLICMLLLILSGIEIHYPVVPGADGHGSWRSHVLRVRDPDQPRVPHCRRRLREVRPGIRQPETKLDMYTFFLAEGQSPSAHSVDQYYPSSSRRSIPGRQVRCTAEAVLPAHRGSHLFMGYTGFCLWAPTMNIAFLPASPRRRRSDEGACHSLLHDVLLHLLHAHPHLPRQHRGHRSDQSCCLVPSRMVV